MKKGIKIIGMDLGLNHSAYVELTDGELSNYWYLTTAAGSAKQSRRGERLLLLKTKDKQAMAMRRLNDIVQFINRKVLRKNSLPDYIGIEDYAIRAEQGAHYLGEIGGLVRYLVYGRRIKLRLHDPNSVKMFTTHDGMAQKDAIERAVKKRWKVDFSKFNQPRPKPTKKKPKPTQKRTTSEDLCDAYAIAKMVWTEVLLRNGHILMKELHPKEIQVFNRITKAYPMSLLDRDWIYKGDKQ